MIPFHLLITKDPKATNTDKIHRKYVETISKIDSDNTKENIWEKNQKLKINTKITQIKFSQLVTK